MNGSRQTHWAFALTLFVVSISAPLQAAPTSTEYKDLVNLFVEWRAFEPPPLLKGAPDYTKAALEKKQAGLLAFRTRLGAIDASAWPIAQQVDKELLWAEMNGLEFNLRVLQPWARDPAFYHTLFTDQSDTPAHEGPTHDHVVELWTFSFPLSASDQTRLARELAVIPSLLVQARENLTGNARDLWIAGIGTMKAQSRDLGELKAKVAKDSRQLRRAVDKATVATDEFVRWLETEAAGKDGPSGIGKDNYTWQLRNVHLVPMSWEEEVALLKRELARAHASLRLEEARNRSLPPLQAIASAEEYQQRAEAAVTRYMTFLERNKIMPIKANMAPALRAQMGAFVPLESRNFFAIANHYEPLTLYTHFYHWWDLAQMRDEPHPSPLRRGPLLYNIWDSRAEGMATGIEEMMLHAGLYDDQPRAREIIWIMLAQRAARGLGSLYAQANEFTMKQAADFHVKWTPRGWMREDLDLLGFEQHLYLRQPGYGSCYITGKILLERLLMDFSRQRGDEFNLSGYFEDINATGMIPVSLIRWQLTGDDNEIRQIRATSESIR